VFIVGGKAFTSTILQRNCHEFISYESLIDSGPARPHRAGPQPQRQQPVRRAEALPLEQALPLVDRALKALERREVKAQLGLLKSTMLQLDSAFTERDYGTSAFSDFVHRLSTAGHVKVHRREGNFVVERAEAREQALPQPSLTREDAIPLLGTVLEANLGFVRVGIPAKELAALFHAAHPGFNHTEYGFTEFEELLNLAQDKAMVRIEAHPELGLRIFPGAELGAHPAPAEGPQQMELAPLEAPAPSVVPAKKRPRRRPPGSKGSSRSRRPRLRPPETKTPDSQPLIAES